VPLPTILATVAGYVVMAVLLLSLNLTSRWRWWIKGGAIIVTGLFFFATYLSIVSLLGWPAGQDRLPTKFALLSTHIVEPDPFTGDEGAIYLWVEALDEDNFVTGQPRAVRLVYSEPQAENVEDAQGLLDQGEQVAGEVGETPQEDGEEAEDGEPWTPGDRAGGGTYYPVEFTLQFNNMPAVVLPDKGAL